MGSEQANRSDTAARSLWGLVMGGVIAEDLVTYLAKQAFLRHKGRSEIPVLYEAGQYPAGKWCCPAAPGRRHCAAIIVALERFILNLIIPNIRLIKSEVDGPNPTPAMQWISLQLLVPGFLGASPVAWETGDPRENTPTNVIVRHDFHMRKSGVTRPGIEPGSRSWEACRLFSQPPWPSNPAENRDTRTAAVRWVTSEGGGGERIPGGRWTPLSLERTRGRARANKLAEQTEQR
ncbi:hypothetical protein PR048_017731 [Dryococelus australis]|uniref:Uncharacterized protein n=1 Tax=Dryococelus australis TaxID=614101 RepID=A0ABQ9HAF4_9NEOP|nr:hypothetical protein PR048_017731 [Dryococelus australis]